MRVVYLHGFASSPSSSKATFFRDKFASVGITTTIPALDGGDFTNLTISSQLAIVNDAVGHQEEPVVLMGSSLGGYLTALFAVRHPQRVSHAILMAPAFCFGRRWKSELPGFETWKRDGVMQVPHFGLKKMMPLRFKLIEDAMQYEDYPDVQQPTLILHGSNDPVVPAGLSLEFARQHPKATLRVFQSGHELTDVVEPMWQDITHFLGI